MLREKVVYNLISGIGRAIGGRESIRSFVVQDDCRILTEIERDVEEDHAAILGRDPAYGGECDLPLVPNAPFQAVLAYRLSHRLWSAGDRELRRLAVAVQHLARVSTGVDIHPGARIGARFIVDHGSGTVVGQTAVIGNDCYILNGVTLGARGIAANPVGRRHPTLGNRVEVGAFARILGPITIGDDVFVSPLACVTEDVPDGARVATPIGRPKIKLRLPPPIVAAPAACRVDFAGRML